MTELHDRLELIAGPVAEPTIDQAHADVARGRRALRRRRAVQRVGASAFAVAALAAAVAYGTSADHSTAPAPQAAAAHLVAYQGEQPEGFTIDKVPDGWEVQGVDASVLTIAPKDAADKNMDSFVGKIAIMLQSQDDHSTPTGTKVTVGGRPGVINRALGTDHGQNLWVREPDGGWLLVQIWDARGWSTESMVEFGAGIHVQPGAQRGRG